MATNGKPFGGLLSEKQARQAGFLRGFSSSPAPAPFSRSLDVGGGFKFLLPAGVAESIRPFLAGEAQAEENVLRIRQQERQFQQTQTLQGLQQQSALARLREAEDISISREKRADIRGEKLRKTLNLGQLRQQSIALGLSTQITETITLPSGQTETATRLKTGQELQDGIANENLSRQNIEDDAQREKRQNESQRIGIIQDESNRRGDAQNTRKLLFRESGGITRAIDPVTGKVINQWISNEAQAALNGLQQDFLNSTPEGRKASTAWAITNGFLTRNEDGLVPQIDAVTFGLWRKRKEVRPPPPPRGKGGDIGLSGDARRRLILEGKDVNASINKDRFVQALQEFLDDPSPTFALAAKEDIAAAMKLLEGEDINLRTLLELYTAVIQKTVGAGFAPDDPNNPFSREKTLRILIENGFVSSGVPPLGTDPVSVSPPSLGPLKVGPGPFGGLGLGPAP